MKIILSPSKTQNFKFDSALPTSNPSFQEDSEYLRSLIQQMSEEEISILMGLSAKLSSQVKGESEKKPAILSFKGDVYSGLDAVSLSSSDLKYANSHLRIISGLYGLLKPLDSISYYRLDMSIKLKNKKGKNLYEFWGNKLTESLEGDLIINLASKEYSKAIKSSNQIDISFKERKGDQLKVIGIHAKKARGVMARFLIKNRVENQSDIKSFTELGYKYSSELSDDSHFVFVR